MRLLDILFPPRSDEAVLRDIGLETFLARLSPTLVSVTRPATVALLPYADLVARAAIHEAKYHGSEHAFSLLAATLADFLPDYLADATQLGHRVSKFVIVPVPLGAARRKERGFNQVEEIAKRALPALRSSESEVGLDISLLTRTRETPSQVSLERGAREKNMRDAFAVHPAKLGERSGASPNTLYIVLDDVLTTGATLQACLDALVAASIPRDHLLPIALAH